MRTAYDIQRIYIIRKPQIFPHKLAYIITLKKLRQISSLKE